MKAVFTFCYFWDDKRQRRRKRQRGLKGVGDCFDVLNAFDVFDRIFWYKKYNNL